MRNQAITGCYALAGAAIIVVIVQGFIVPALRGLRMLLGM